MGKNRFDFSEIDAALPATERMQEKDRSSDALENNYKAIGILSDKVEKLENRLSEALPNWMGLSLLYVEQVKLPLARNQTCA